MKNDATGAFAEVCDDLHRIRNGLVSITADLEIKTLEDRASERRALLGGRLAEALQGHPVSCEEIGYSYDTVKRFKEGKGHPTEKIMKQLLDRMAALETPLPPERRRELEEGHRAAGEVPWLSGQRLAAASKSMSIAAAKLAATAVRVEKLQRAIADLKTALAAAADGSDEELRLRSELDQANMKLRDALAQEHKDTKYLVVCATETSRAISAYLDLVNRRPPTLRRSPINRLPRRAERTPEHRRRRRKVAGRHRSGNDDRR